MRGLGKSFDSGGWMVLLLLALAIVLPASALLWFMNEAARSQALAARQSVGAAYRGQVRLLQERVAAEWRSHVDAAQTAAGGGLPAYAADALRTSGADAVLMFDE